MILKSLPARKEIFWTRHSRQKMRQYHFSEKRVLRILRKPDRIEEGIAPGTMAAMELIGSKKHPKEAWVMYQIIEQKRRGIKNLKLKIISAWRYPGRTPEGQRPLIPADILEELEPLFKK